MADTALLAALFFAAAFVLVNSLAAIGGHGAAIGAVPAAIAVCAAAAGGVVGSELGSGDIGSAVAHRLALAGFALLIHESKQPTATRRGMAFTDAVFDGQAVLDGVQARRIDDTRELSPMLHARAVVLTIIDLARALEIVRPAVLVDARMRKAHRSRHPTRSGAADHRARTGVRRRRND